MGHKLVQVSGKDLSRVVIRLGFVLEHQRGSHMKFIRRQSHGKETVVIPNHKVIRKGTLHGILKQLNLDFNTFESLLK